MSSFIKRFPIPILWVYIFAGPAFLVVGLLSFALQDIRHPGIVILVSALLVFPVVYFLLHKACVFLESRGWIYYRRPKTGGLAAGTILDLEILFSGRNSQVENVRMAREALNEGLQQDGQGDVPPEKKTVRHE